MGYQRILCAVDLGDGSEHILQRARELAERYSARLSVTHVVEPVIPSPPYELPGIAPLELEQQMLEHARLELGKLGQKYQLDAADMIVGLGTTRSVIITTAEEQDIDLIVLGSHGRHGVGLLLGSTANAVLHHASCDVLAVRIGSEPK